MATLSSREVVQELNRIYAEELEAAMRYMHLRSAVRGLERLTVEPVLKEGFEETIQHAEVIARKIRSLGYVPKLQLNVQCPPEPVSAREALRLVLTVEEAALEGYQELLGRVLGDVPLEEFVRSQIAVESEHVAQIKELLTE